MMDKFHVYKFLHIASIRSTTGNKTRLFPCLFLFSTSSCPILAEVFWNNYVAACSTALRSATEKHELGGHVNVPCPSNMTQRSSTADWL